MTFKNIEEALAAIGHDAARDAWAYLQREKADSANAIQYLIANNWSEKQILDRFTKAYGPTEEKTMHKIKLVIKALIAGKID